MAVALAVNSVPQQIHKADTKSIIIIIIIMANYINYKYRLHKNKIIVIIMSRPDCRLLAQKVDMTRAVHRIAT